MTTSEVLNKAADLIEERGWTVGTVGWLNGADDGLCLEGGIMAAVGITTHGAALWDCPAYQAVADYLDRPVFVQRPHGEPVRNLFTWNDQRDNAAPVIEVLRACAVIEASREREAAEVSS